MSKVHVVPRRKALVVPYAPQFETVFPHGRRFSINGNDYYAIKHGIGETRLLRRLGAKVPSPMRTRYRWPRKPWDAQQVTADLLVMNRRAYVLNEMGTGKTFSALAAADFLMHEKQVQCAAIVAPISTLAFTWRDEIMRWFPHRRCVILHADAARRKQLLAIPNDFYIINHDGVEVLFDELQARRDINLVILDELATYRNGRPREKDERGRWRFRHRLFSFAQDFLKGRHYAWGMTGAPCPNAPLDAWAQVRLLTPNNVHWSWSKFRSETMIQINEHTWVERPEGMGRVYSVMQPAVRFKLEDCQDIPPVVEETRRVVLSRTQQKAYDTVMAEIGKQIRVEENGRLVLQLDAVNEAVQLNKLCQIACGYAYNDQSHAVDLKPKDRLQELLNVIQGASHKVIVFVPFVGAIDGVTRFLQGKKVDTASISGNTSRKARDAIFAAFQNTPQYKTLVAQPGTMSHGLTLTAANVIVWYAPIHSLDTYIQANRRITRPGQQNRQVLVHLTGSPVEDRMYARLRRKERMLGLLLELFEQSTRDA